MGQVFFQTARGLVTALCVFAAIPAQAEPQHGIAMYGEPALPPDFVSLPYANPDAPYGGTVVTGEVGSFDSLNPHVRKGRVPWQLRYLAYESLMGRNWDEPFSLYGVLAETIETDSSNRWVEFVLREEARFSDGSPVTVEDVIWSYETLGNPEIGHPRYISSWTKIDSVSQTGPRSVRFDFNVEDKELALIMGLRPILKKAQWEGKDIGESGLDEIPITTAPYMVAEFEAGRFVTLKRDPDYWGKDLAFRRGTNVIDEVKFEFFADATSYFEAFKVGIVNTFRETNATKWAQQFNFERVSAGDVIKTEVPHQRPSGINGFVMNTRRDQFKDWRVREAMIQAFNFEFINEKLTGASEPRITSYFGNSPLGMRPGAAEGEVASLLAPYEGELVPGTLEGYVLPVSDGSVRNRGGIRNATALLEEAGYVLKDGVLTGPDGKPFVFEILLRNGSAENASIANIYIEALERLGVFATIASIDSAQYRERTDKFDFDMTTYTRGLSLSPGNEQSAYWGSDAAELEGSRNLMGVQMPVIDAMIGTMVNAADQDQYRAAVRALDRVLTAGRYVVPFWYSDVSRIAYNSDLKFPEKIPLYGDFIGFQPDVWWSEK